MRNKTNSKLEISFDQKQKLDNLISARSTPNSLVVRAKIIKNLGLGMNNKQTALKLGINRDTVSCWRTRFIKFGITGLGDSIRTGRPLKSMHITEEQSLALKSWSNSMSLPANLVQRAKIILHSNDGKSNNEIAASLSITPATVAKWKKRFDNNGMEGLHDEYRPGAPRTYNDEKIAELLKKTIESKPKAETHWSCRSMEVETAISKTTVNRIWNTFCIQPHATKGFKISTDPFFVDKVKDVVGLYLNPPANAVVLAVDEKSQCQALERTQPILPLGLGYAEGVTDNYFRHGTTTLFAALDIATGKVDTVCKKHHRHQEFIQFLNQINKNVPANLDVHVILDNYSTHKHAKVRAWLARNPRFYFHFTPTYSSWLNQVERWFGIITDKAIRRASFRSVKQLVHKINEFVEKYNKNSRPFIWTKSAEEILEKIERLCNRLLRNNY